MQDTQLIELYQKVQDATRRLEAKTAEILDMT